MANFSVLSLSVALLLSSQFAAPVAFADAESDNDKEYLEALRIADRHVQKKRGQQIAALRTENALSSSLLISLYGKYYQVGDSWEVATVRFTPGNLTHNPGHTHGTKKIKDGALPTSNVVSLRYVVKEVKNGPNREARIEITEIPTAQNYLLDSKVKSITLVMDDRMKESKKSYLYVDGSRSGSISSNGPKTLASGLELLPLDVPDLSTGTRSRLDRLPSLPGALQMQADRVKFAPDLSRSVWFDEDDFFGRPVRILWQHGDPWPSYLETTTGVAILLNKTAGSNR